ncbi:MAG: extracellular solute-binding protein, partial [Oscillospiraceae bacterium]|nr:extracellular solute-binding protein [Oscillospiraceae bacterium]
MSNVSYLEIAYGEDYTDLEADITFLTSRSDLITDTEAPFEFPDYLKEFHQAYPNINVYVEAATDYDFDIGNRLISGNWGEVCSIPGGVQNSELSNYFLPYFTLEEAGDQYHAIDSKVYENIVYGIPSGIDVQGIVYNKKVWEDAGITELPKTPEEFLADLQQIKEKTNAIPLYTNYEAGWPLVNWDFQAVGAGVGVDNYMNDVMLTTARPFVKQADNTGMYAVYQLLYDCVQNGLTEKDPHSSSWELCKGRM